MVNKAFDKNAPMSGSHVISKEKGDQLRKDNNITKKRNSPTVEEKIDALKDIYKPTPLDKANGIDVEKMQEMGVRMQNRILRSRGGLIDWRDALIDFATERSMKWEENDELDKVIYDAEDIGIWGRQRVQEQFNKCVLYIDTSGSVNNEMTQLIPIMASEVGKIVNDCDFQSVDIHLFHHYIYDNDRYIDIPADEVKDESFAIEDVEDGGTNIQKVYEHILDNYTDGGVISDDVNAIIIITDLSGMETSGNIHKKLKSFDESTLSRMLYVVYNDYTLKNEKEIKDTINKLVSDYSTHFEISLEIFRQQLEESEFNVSENIKYRHMKCIRLNEVAGGRRGKPQVAQIDIKSIDDIDKIELSDDEVNDIQRKSDFEVYRSLGKLDELDLTKDIISALNDFNSNLKSVDDYQFVVKQKDTYFVLLGTDGITVIINTDIDNLNWSDFAELCQKIKISTLIGNIYLEDCDDFSGFPNNFPSNVTGDITIKYCDYFKNLNNFPTNVIGDVYIMSSDRAFQYEINNFLRKNNYSTKNDASFKNNRIWHQNESVQDIINKRISLGLSYINESFPKSLRGILGARHNVQNDKIKSATKRQKALDDYVRSSKNQEVFKQFIQPVVDIDWGNASDENMTIIDNTKTIKNIIREQSVFSSLEDKANSPWTYSKPGVEFMVDGDNYIRVAYTFDTSGKYQLSTLLFIVDRDGNVYSGGNDVKNFLRDRLDYFKMVRDDLQNLGISPDNIVARQQTEDKTYTVEDVAFHILYYNLVLLNGKGYAKQNYTYNTYSILNDDYIIRYDGRATLENILNSVFGSNWTYGNNNGKIYPDSRKTRSGSDYFWIDQTTNQRGYKDGFISNWKKYGGNKSVFDYLSDEFLKCMLSGISIRKIDNKPIYMWDDIQKMDRDKLLKTIKELKDVDVYDTILKAQSYSGVRNNKITLSFDTLLLLPDLYSKCYAYRCDLNKEILNKINMGFDRLASRTNSVDPMRRVRPFTPSQRNESDEFYFLDTIISEFNDMKRRGVLDSIKSSIKNSYDEEYASELIEDLNQSIQFISAIDLTPDEAKDVTKQIKKALISMDNLYSTDSNYSANKRDVKEFVNNSEKLVELLSKLKFNSSEKIGIQNIRDASKRHNKKLSDRKPLTLNTASFKKDEPKSMNKRSVDARSVINNLTEYSDKIKDILENADFDEDLEDMFSTKENMIRIVGKNLDNVLTKALTIFNGSDESAIQSIEPQVQTISNTCYQIANTNINDSDISEYIIKLNNECLNFKFAVKKLSITNNMNQYVG